jgi:nitrogen fixation protein FixH
MSSRRWIFVCVGLLVTNALVMAVLVTASSRSAPAVVPQYYERAVAWDQTMAEARLAAELGWSLELSLDGDRAKMRLSDRAGQPVAGAALTIGGFHRAQPALRIELSRVTDSSGEATASLAAPRTAGWYELDIGLERGAVRYSLHRAVELRDVLAARRP